MTAIAVYRRILATYRREARALLLLSLLIFVPVGLLKAIPVEIDVNRVGPVEGGALLAAFLVEVSLSFIGAIFYSGAVARLVEEEEGMWERQSLTALLRRLPYARLAAIDVIVTVATALGLLLFVLPGIAILTSWSLAAPVAEIEERPARSALRRSRELVRGHFRLVLSVVFPIWLAGAVLESGAEALANAVLGDGIPADWLAATVALSAYTPIYALATVLLAVGLARGRA
jgi:hypothetical protein